MVLVFREESLQNVNQVKIGLVDVASRDGNLEGRAHAGCHLGSLCYMSFNRSTVEASWAGGEFLDDGAGRVRPAACNCAGVKTLGFQPREDNLAAKWDQ